MNREDIIDWLRLFFQSPFGAIAIGVVIGFMIVWILGAG